MEHYERPAVLATYSVEELVEEAAICGGYGSGRCGPPGRVGSVPLGPPPCTPGNPGPIGRNR